MVRKGRLVQAVWWQKQGQMGNTSSGDPVNHPLSGRVEALTGSICQFPWCKYPHGG